MREGEAVRKRDGGQINGLRLNADPVDIRRVRNYQLDVADVHADGDGAGAFLAELE